MAERDGRGMTYNKDAIMRYRRTAKGRAALARAEARRPARSPEERERRKWAQIFTLYGVTREQFEQKLREQNGTCVFCDSTKLHIDHCHNTGKFRGLLCVRHNTALGVFGDGVDGLRRAIEYLA